MSLKKILIADDHSLFRKGLATLLRDEWPAIEIIEAGNGIEIIEQYQKHKPEILLIDYSMPTMDGYEAAEKLLKKDKQIKIILFTLFDTPAIAVNFFKIGGRGFISKGGNSDEVIKAIRTVSNGDYYFHSNYEADIAQWLKIGDQQKVPKIRFTPLELEIIIKMSKGLSSKEIGNDMNLSPRTVETYRYDLIKKTAVKNSNELIEFTFRNGII